MNTASTVTVLLVDDHAVVREGYRRLLERTGRIRVIGEAADAASALLLCQRLTPQLVVMDITLPDISGIEATRRMIASQPGLRVLMFSMHEDTIFARRALEAGAYGYVTKASAPQVLVEAVTTVAGGRKYLSPTIAQQLALRVAGEREGSHDLSGRELEVLGLLAQGRSVRQIAQSMNLTPKTIANHQSAIKHKLGAHTSIQLLQMAQRLGMGQTR